MAVVWSRAGSPLWVTKSLCCCSASLEGQSRADCVSGLLFFFFLTNGNDDRDGNAGCCGLFVSFVVISPLHLPPVWCCAWVIHTLFSSVLLFPFSGEGAEPLRS